MVTGSMPTHSYFSNSEARPFDTLIKINFILIVQNLFFFFFFFFFFFLEIVTVSLLQQSHVCILDGFCYKCHTTDFLNENSL